MKSSKRIFQRRATNTRELFEAIVAAKTLMRQDNPKVRGALTTSVSVVVRKDDETGEMVLEVGD